MAITTISGKKFIQVLFSTGTGESWAMDEPKLVRSVRVTAPPTMLGDADYITFGEVANGNPNVFTLSSEGKATNFYGSQSTKLSITDYSLTHPASVVVSIEMDDA